MHLHAYFILKLLLASVLCKKNDEQKKNPQKTTQKTKTNKQANNQTNKTEKRKQQQITKCPS